jgi:hypothetical protein
MGNDVHRIRELFLEATARIASEYFQPPVAGKEDPEVISDDQGRKLAKLLRSP